VATFAIVTHESLLIGRKQEYESVRYRLQRHKKFLSIRTKNLMHTVPKPNFLDVPQFGQTVLAGKRASFLIASSGDMDAMVVVTRSEGIAKVRKWLW
jgi:hypothetical protein